MEILGKDSVKDHSIRRIAARVAVVSTAAVALVGSYGVVSAGATVNAGVATITDPANNQAPLASGSASKLFSVTLPARAACAGDTPTGGYHVYSFLVQSGTDVSTLTFLPNPSVGYGLIDNTGSYYGPANTATGTGQIIGIPNNFEWSKLTASNGFGLPLSTVLYRGTSGVWDTGIACVNKDGQVSDYWTTEVTFTASASAPCRFTWAAVPGVPTGAPEAPLAIVFPVVGLAVAGGAIARPPKWASRRLRVLHALTSSPSPRVRATTRCSTTR